MPDVFNPIFTNQFKNKNYSSILKIDENMSDELISLNIFTNQCLEKLNTHECPICLEQINSKSDKSLCFAFQCQHGICFKCFYKLCSYHNSFQKRIQTIKCPLCRNKTNNFWVLGKKINHQTISHINNTIKIALPYDF